uniref:Uncharacterized protein n=1 Tax=Romanomermis culicivorax TaxID=13658 RepID=A0A915IMA6_ROMCU
MAINKKDSIREQKAMREKEKGNQAFKNGKFDEAINKYSLAIECDQGQPVIYCNRAMAYLKLNRFYEAKLDCDEAIKLDSTYVKAYFRRGLANSSLKDVDSAITDFNCVLELDPNNKEAKNELIKLEKGWNGYPDTDSPRSA